MQRTVDLNIMYETTVVVEGVSLSVFLAQVEENIWQVPLCGDTLNLGSPRSFPKPFFFGIRIHQNAVDELSHNSFVHCD